MIRSTTKSVLRRLLAYRVRLKLRQLRSINNVAADRIANAVNDTLNCNLTSEEKKWVSRIEELRSALSASAQEITITDYGAGDSNAVRTEEEMFAGVATTVTVSEVCRDSKRHFWSVMLFKLVREFRPITCIELGTSLGISAAYQAAAQKLNRKGNTTTLEGAASLAFLAQKNLQRLGLDNAVVVSGRFQDNLQRVLTQNAPIDYAFIDGHHDEKATISYFEKFVPPSFRNSGNRLR